MSGTTNWGNFGADPLGTLGSAVGNNASLLLGGLGLGYDALKGSQPPEGYDQLLSSANSLQGTSNQLIQNGLNGALPPGAQAQVNQAANAQTAQVNSTYSKMGLGGSTMQAQAMQQIGQQKIAASYQMAQGMVTDGLKMAGMDFGLFSQIANYNVAQDQEFGKAIGNFSASLAGASHPANYMPAPTAQGQAPTGQVE